MVKLNKRGLSRAYVNIVEISATEAWSSVATEHDERVPQDVARVGSSRVWAPLPTLLECHRP